MKKAKRSITAIELLIIVIAVLTLSVIFGFGYVIAHFIGKFW